MTHLSLFHTMTHLSVSHDSTPASVSHDEHTCLCSRPAVTAIWHRRGEGRKGVGSRRRRRSSCRNSRSVRCSTGSAATWTTDPAAGTGWTSSSTCRKQAEGPVTPADGACGAGFFLHRHTTQSLWLSSVSAPSSRWGHVLSNH